MTRERVGRLMEEAVRTNKERDDIDQVAGFASPNKLTVNEQLIIIQEAIHTGLRSDDFTCIAEAGAMLAALTGYRPWNRQ